MAVVAPADEDKKTCQKCGVAYEVKEGRQHGPSFVCWPCNNISQTLRRNLGTSGPVGKMSAEDQVSFFTAAKSQKGTDGKVSWNTIRATLLKRMTQRIISSFSIGLEVEELPKSVLLKRGWEAEVVDNFPHFFDDAYGCDLYRVPIRKLSWQECQQKVEEEIVELEKAASQKKGKSSAGLDLPPPSGQAPEEGKSKNVESEEKKVQKQNDKIASLAAKAMGPLTSQESSLSKLLARAEGKDEVDAAARTLCETSLEKIRNWLKRAQGAMNAQQCNKDSPENVVALEALPFSQEDVKILLKQSSAAQTDIKAALSKATKAKAKAKAESAPAAHAEGTAPSEPARKRRRAKTPA